MASADKRQLGADLSAYLDGELSPRRARRIERLLEESEDARHLLAELRAVSRDLGDLPRMHAPEGLVERIRHAAKRWVASPPRRVPASRVRVLRLVTRVVASAAVIVVCVFAGWMVRDRVAPRVSAVSDGVTRGALATEERAAKTLVRGGRPGRGAPADVAAAEAPAVAMGELRSLGYTGDDVDAEAESVPLAEAPFLGEEVLVAARPPLSEADESTFAFAATTPAGDVRPDVSVVVAPGYLEQINTT